MNILYAYRYGIVGGVSTQLLLRRRALAEAGIRCTLFFCQDKGLAQVLVDHEDIHFGERTSFKRLVRGERFDAVVVVDTPELLSSAFGPCYRRSRVFLDVHTTTRAGLAYLADIHPSKFAAVMAPTRYSANLVAERMPGSVGVDVVPNILDASTFSIDPSTAAPDGESSTRHYVWVGKLDHHKNWRLALVYTAMLRQMFGSVRMHIVGGYTAPASQANAFFRWLHQLGIYDSVSWLDRVNSNELSALYRRCAASRGLMLITSRDESFGMAATEALLCGCPIVANNLPVFREVFPESSMIQLVDIWRPEEVAHAAANVEVPTPTDAELMHHQLATRYSPQAFVHAFKNLLNNR